MCKQPITAEHFAVADWNKANGTNAMERLLTHHEFVGIRRRGPLPLQVHIASIGPCGCQGPNALPTGVRSAGRPYAKQYHRSRCGYHCRPVRSNPSMPPQSQPVFLRRTRRWKVCIVQYVTLAVLRLATE